MLVFCHLDLLAINKAIYKFTKKNQQTSEILNQCFPNLGKLLKLGKSFSLGNDIWAHYPTQEHLN